MTAQRLSPAAISAAEVNSERRVRQMRVVILVRRNRIEISSLEIFLVIVILIADVPINVSRQTNRRSNFRHIEPERIRADDNLRRGRDAVALSRVPIETITRVKRNSLDRLRRDINERVTVTHIKLAETRR